MPIAFLTDTNEGYLLLKDANNKQINFATELKNSDNNLGLFFNAREKVLNNFQSTLFLIKNLDKIPTSEPKPELAA